MNTALHNVYYSAPEPEPYYKLNTAHNTLILHVAHLSLHTSHSQVGTQDGGGKLNSDVPVSVYLVSTRDKLNHKCKWYNHIMESRYYAHTCSYSCRWEVHKALSKGVIQSAIANPIIYHMHISQ